MLGTVVLSCVGTHSLWILRRIVDGTWGSHERRWRTHGMEHVWPKTCGKKMHISFPYLSLPATDKCNTPKFPVSVPNYPNLLKYYILWFSHL